MVLLAIVLAVLVALGLSLDWDARVLAGVAVLIGLVSGLFVWLVGVIGLVPLIGPIIVKVLSFSFIWLLNAMGYLVSYVAIRRGYSRDVLTYRGLTMALLIGIVIGYIVAQFI
jgi:fatty-acid desaturase